MKNSIIFFSLSLIAFYSCTGEEQDKQESLNHKLVRFTINRATESSTGIQEDTAFGIYMVQRTNVETEGTLIPSGNAFDNKKFILHSEALSPEEKIYYPEGIQSFDVYAYTPYSTEGLHQNTLLPFTVQSIQTDITDSDLLWASLKKITPNTPSKFIFNHLLSKIKIVLASGPDVTLTSPTALINNALLETSLDMQAGTVGVATGTTSTIQAQKISSTDTTAIFEAIIVPQTISKLDKFLTFVNGDKSYSYDLAESKEFKTGTIYTYHFMANNNGKLDIVLTGNVGEWTPDGTWEGNLTPD